ncbi:MAG: BREX system Lon protease-like protein BrxL [Methanosarcina sp.]|nr:BREX system Lon protease-like protein BrxL [Methanosarcina sp.]MDD3872860.1 BREX system Lon protease-like protein BrxL [Methanosarcina sp.]MDD4522521.1 BREX system Lon protease-like protein BrxL [Methanosarcina sp.]
MRTPENQAQTFTDRYGFIVDYITEFFREMRKCFYSDHITRFLRFGNNLNLRDVIAVKKTSSGLVKLFMELVCLMNSLLQLSSVSV